MEDRRQSKRIPFRFNIRYGLTESPEHSAFISDFSETGVCINTNRVFAPGTELCLVIETIEGNFRAEGLVVWARKAPPHLVRHMKNGMGIKFSRVDEGLIELYKKES